jgi:hypothetical protein
LWAALRPPLLAPPIVLAVVLGCADFAGASWVTIKNDTSQPIVVQETTTVKGQAKRGKPTSLLPGETLREFIPGPTVKRIQVFDPQRPDQSLWSGNLNCNDETQTFSVSGAGGRVTVRPVANPPAAPKK